MKKKNISIKDVKIALLATGDSVRQIWKTGKKVSIIDSFKIIEIDDSTITLDDPYWHHTFKISKKKLLLDHNNELFFKK